ncbi:Fc.00g034460.m01.CDS01 [Cosmosporella sp. VM-42]
MATRDETGDFYSIVVRAAVPWQARHGMTSIDYQDTFGELVNDGYRLTYVSGYTISDDSRFAAIWDKDVTSDWVARHGMTSAEYQSQFNVIAAQGFRPRLVNGYTVQGEARFAALWDKSPVADWVARHDMTSSQYQSEFDNFVSQGFRLTHVSGYTQGDQVLYAALWEKSGTDVDWVAHHGLTSADYQKLSDQYVGNGFRTILVNGYVVNNVDYYVAIWDKSPSGSWVSRHGMSSTDYQSEVDKWVALGYRLTVVSGYTLNSKDDRYAAIFVQD